MSSRPAVYVSHRGGDGDITVDLRVFAEPRAPREAVIEAALNAFIELIDKIAEEWE